MLIALLPFIAIIFLVLIILGVCASIFGSQENFYRSSFVLPFDTSEYTITSPYGDRNNPVATGTEFHNGVDVVPISSNIVAIADGIVVVSSYSSSAGEQVVIEHKINGTTYRSGYYHLKENSRVVKVGDKVKQAQQIGLMGSSGISTGPHLHLFLQVYNAKDQKFDYTDPTIILKNKITADSYNLYDYNNNKFTNPFNQGNLINGLPNLSS